MKYRVHIQFVGSTSIEVEAEDEADAMEQALEHAPQNDFGIAEWDAGDWYVNEDSEYPAVTQLT